MKKNILFIVMSLLGMYRLHAQSIQLANGTPLPNEFCFNDTVFQITTGAVGERFQGCGVYQQNGLWYFNPSIAAQGVTVFPYGCNITYVSSHASINKRLIIHKPVIIEPSLKDLGSCDGSFIVDATTRYAGSYQFSWHPYQYVTNSDRAQTTGLVPSSTRFYLTAIDNVSGCMGQDSMMVSKYPAPELRIGLYDSVIASREQVLLSVSGANSYQWTPSKWLSDYRSSMPVASPQESITYTIRGMNEYNCYDSVSLHIRVLDDIFIPTAFSPNGDGLNDYFRISNIGYQGNGGFHIYNRLGNLVFAGTRLTDSWDGTHKGVPAPSGVYFYLIVLNNLDGSSKQYKGEITLLR